MRTDQFTSGVRSSTIQQPLKAKFGFYSKYRPGISVPVGETDFQFQAAGFIFQANVYH